MLTKSSVLVLAAAGLLAAAASTQMPPTPDTSWTRQGDQPGATLGSRARTAILRDGPIVCLTPGPASTRELVRIDPQTGGELGRIPVTVAHLITSLDAVGDVDGDGVGDYAVLSPYAGQRAGQVELRSGADDSVVATFVGLPSRVFGQAVADAGDSNGDGRDEIFVSAIRDSQFGSPWVARYDVANPGNPEMWRATGNAALGFTQLGYDLASHDLNGDGAVDLIAGAPGTDIAGVGAQAGQIRFYNGPTGSPILGTMNGTDAGGRLGTSVAAVATGTDMGWVVAGGAPDESTSTAQHCGAVYTRDDQNAAVNIVYGQNDLDRVGTFVDGCEAWNGRFAVTVRWPDNSGGLFQFDPPTSQLHSLASGNQPEDYVEAIGPSLDDDFLMGASGDDNLLGTNAGRMESFDLFSGGFRIQDTQLFLGQGGTHDMQIDLGPQNANAPCIFFGGITQGPTPTPWGLAPTSNDWYTGLAPGWINGWLGILDSNGQATASITITSNQYSVQFAGFQAWHGGATLSGGSGLFTDSKPFRLER